MRYFIYESHASDELPYDGPSCHFAGVIPGKYYETEAEALADVEKLGQVNAVCWLIRPAHTPETLQQKFPKMAVHAYAEQLWVDTQQVRNPFTISDLLTELQFLAPERPVNLTCDGNSYTLISRADIFLFGAAFQLREGLYSSHASRDLASV